MRNVDAKPFPGMYCAPPLGAWEKGEPCVLGCIHLKWSFPHTGLKKGKEEVGCGSNATDLLYLLSLSKNIYFFNKLYALGTIPETLVGHIFYY